MSRPLPGLEVDILVELELAGGRGLATEGVDKTTSEHDTQDC